jgi:LuxR family maltose regulon positive regulatory protein
MEKAGEPGVAEHFVACLPHLAAAVLRAASGRAEAAVGVSTRALALARRGAGRPELAMALAVRAQTADACGDDGRHWLEQARTLIRQCPEPGHLPQRLARVRIGRPASAPQPTGDSNGAVALTERERDLLPLLAGTLSQREIGGVLHLSLNTVKTHNRVLFRKLGVTSRAEAVTRARELGLL